LALVCRANYVKKPIIAFPGISRPRQETTITQILKGIGISNENAMNRRLADFHVILAQETLIDRRALTGFCVSPGCA
jgi:hypothetical protein